MSVNLHGLTPEDVAHLDAGMEVVVEFNTGIQRGVLRSVAAIDGGQRLVLSEPGPSVVLPEGEPGVHLVRVISPTPRAGGSA